jgi:hypothetical protein
MYRTVLILALLACVPAVQAAPQADYAVLTISRERLALPTGCDIGVMLQDQLAARLMPGESASFNLPAGPLSIRLAPLGPGPCGDGIAQAAAPLNLNLQAGQHLHYDLAAGTGGYYLKPSAP